MGITKIAIAFQKLAGKILSATGSAIAVVIANCRRLNKERIGIMGFIKKFLLSIVVIAIIATIVLGLDADDWIHKGGYILAAIVALLLLNIVLKIAWRILLFIIFALLIFIALVYFDVITLPSFGEIAKSMFN